jgi:hypothetical protein
MFSLTAGLFCLQSAPMTDRVPLVKDHELVLQGTAAMLSSSSELQLFGQTRSIREAILVGTGP